MRKTWRSSQVSSTSRLRARALARSRPNGFSITTRVNRVSRGGLIIPAAFSCLSNVGNVLGGVAK